MRPLRFDSHLGRGSHTSAIWDLWIRIYRETSSNKEQFITMSPAFPCDPYFVDKIIWNTCGIQAPHNVKFIFLEIHAEPDYSCDNSGLASTFWWPVVVCPGNWTGFTLSSTHIITAPMTRGTEHLYAFYSLFCHAIFTFTWNQNYWNYIMITFIEGEKFMLKEGFAKCLNNLGVGFWPWCLPTIR